MKKAVILFNLGGPDKLENVEPFLFNLFNDPAILNLPSFLRFPLAKLIANRRAPTAKKIYQELGGSSPILKLTEEDYNRNGMSELLAIEGNYYDLNIKMFNHFQNKITGWPGGKPNSDDSKRPERSKPAKKKCLILLFIETSLGNELSKIPTKDTFFVFSIILL